MAFCRSGPFDVDFPSGRCFYILNMQKVVETKKVFVAMSGGVDSSMAAKLLQDQEYEVIGVYFDLQKNNGQDWRMVKQVCASLGVKCAKVNFVREFRQEVIDYFCDSYARGQTPNPCVVCNRQIKFGLFWRWAKEQGADFIATGHYARLRQEFSIFNLCRGKDKDKDQSYFLYRLTQKDLKHILFPLGDYTKKEIIELAKKHKLPNANKFSSQDVCFLSGKNLSEFLSQKIKSVKAGKIKELETKKPFGDHRGLTFYTYGQRAGIGLAGGPWYVAEKDARKNTLYVTKNKKKLLSKKLTCRKLSWITDKKPESPRQIRAQIRYRSNPSQVIISQSKKNKKDLRVVFAKAQYAIAPGQSVVFYQGEKVLGGGIISQ